MATKPVKKNLSAQKRVRQSVRRQQRNQSYRSAVKTLSKKFHEAVNSNDAEKAQTEYRNVIKVLNKASSKNILHRNNVSRRISKISQKLHKFLTDQPA